MTAASPTSAPVGVRSEVGRLRTVLLHRPGDELRRLTPRNNDQLLFDGVPWVDRAQEEHDAFAAALTDRGVEVLYLGDLLRQAPADAGARDEATTAALDRPSIGHRLATRARAFLDDLDHDELAEVLIAGLRH